MSANAADIFTAEWTSAVFPPERTEAFFEALFGGAEDGAYDISLRYMNSKGDTHQFCFDLTQRPGKCLACNLTYGLPQVFSRHPVLNVKGIAEAAAAALGKDPASVRWDLGATTEHSATLHSIPFVVIAP
ncbi:pancreas/duodenum homeobox protein 1 [Desulfovibrio sp. OttesenSCG-928-M14]|nr:pancreas/duodenum homeobox protein 1 [Desulfovibrio sp. OttesenSCG-928-M14]